MCEKCPPLLPPTDPEAVRLAADLIARCQALIPPGGTPDSDARNMLIAAGTFCRNALLSHTGGVSGENMLIALAHLTSIEIGVRTETIRRNANLPEAFLPLGMQRIADKYAEWLSQALSNALRSNPGDIIFPAPSPRKEAS